MLIQSHKIIAYGGALLWMALAALTVGGLLISMDGWAPNVVIGLLFALIGGFFFWRTRAFHRFHAALADEVSGNSSFHRYLLPEVLLMLGILLFVTILLTGAISRVFGEGVPVFG